MKIAVLSGKGGTGKTFVAVNLAAAAQKAFYADCDIEEPNGYLFFKPDNIKKQKITVKVPVINAAECTGCRKCVEFCRFNALAFVKNNVMVFNELCHSCGGCKILCPNQAISEKERETGVIEEGVSDNVTVFTGCLNTGEASGVPIIKELIKKLPEDNISIIDCPPGSACTVMESIRKSDYCLLVAEPTLFGVHNMAMVYELVKLFNKPYGAVINKYLSKDNPAGRFCNENNIKILEEIPYDLKLGEIISNGRIAVRENGEYNKIFKKLLGNITKEAL